MEHKMKCNSCGQIIDLRDLSQVFAHEHCDKIPIDYATMKQISHSAVQKIGGSILYSKKCGEVVLN